MDSEAMTFSQPTVLMCPPDYYGIEYEINPWMSRGRQSDPARSRAQWQALHALLTSLGADVRLMSAEQGLPDLVFTANAGLVWRDVVFLSRFRHAARRGETPLDEAWFQSQGFETEHLAGDWNFEGAGDALFCGDTLYAGYLIRSDVPAMQWIARRMGCRVIPLQLDTHYYHLDTCFCPLSPTEAVYHPDAFDEYALQALKAHVPELIAVDSQEAARFCCNAVVLGRNVVLNSGCPRLEDELRLRGYIPHATELDEFLKAGGSAKCLTLRLDGEDAAIWP
jgi:N-dimethylarginine dimethylaminohydrolase